MTNGEKFKAVTERERGFLLFCNKHNDDGSCVKCPLNNKARKRLGCAYAWLDLEAEEEKPMNCPFCGGEIYLAYDSYGQAYVGCKSGNCMYTYCNDGKSDYEIIAAHNRVCKAVAAYKESEVNK